MNNPLEEYQARKLLEQARTKTRRTRTPIPKHITIHLHNQPCANCQSQPIEIHHLIPRSNFHPSNPTTHHPDNLLPLCHPCHQNHHTTAHRRIPRHILTQQHINFILQHKPQTWLDKWYP